jgi:hypothetical protein
VIIYPPKGRVANGNRERIFFLDWVYPVDAVTVVRGDPSRWKLKRNPRMTCRECGTRLFTDVEAQRLRGVNGFLLPEGKFEPAFVLPVRGPPGRR